MQGPQYRACHPPARTGPAGLTAISTSQDPQGLLREARRHLQVRSLDHHPLVLSCPVIGVLARKASARSRGGKFSAIAEAGLPPRTLPAKEIRAPSCRSSEARLAKSGRP